jgi:hypothetical protein
MARLASYADNNTVLLRFIAAARTRQRAVCAVALSQADYTEWLQDQASAEVTARFAEEKKVRDAQDKAARDAEKRGEQARAYSMRQRQAREAREQQRRQRREREAARRQQRTSSFGTSTPGPSLHQQNRHQDAVKKLIDMGFDEQKSREALAANGWNVQRATEQLLG